MKIWVRILAIKPERFWVDCSSKTSDLRDEDFLLQPQRDAYYDTEVEKKEKEKETIKAQAKKGPAYIKRVITHSSFLFASK